MIIMYFDQMSWRPQVALYTFQWLLRPKCKRLKTRSPLSKIKVDNLFSRMPIVSYSCPQPQCPYTQESPTQEAFYYITQSWFSSLCNPFSCLVHSNSGIKLQAGRVHSTQWNSLLCMGVQLWFTKGPIVTKGQKQQCVMHSWDGHWYLISLRLKRKATQSPCMHGHEKKGVG